MELSKKASVQRELLKVQEEEKEEDKEERERHCSLGAAALGPGMREKL